MRWDDFLHQMARYGITHIPVHNNHSGNTVQFSSEVLAKLGFTDAAAVLQGAPREFYCRTLNPFHDSAKKYGRAA